MIQVDGLTKRFGRLKAIDDIAFHIGEGEIVGLLGPNGAGKTTTMRIISTFLPATGGTVTVNGMDAFRNPVEVRRSIGYLPEHVPLYNEMRVHEYLSYRGRLKGLRGRFLKGRMDEMLNACGLVDVRRTIIGTLSKGYRQRIGLADSLIHEPRVLILDEPTIGLDPNQIRQIRNLIKGLAPKHTVLLSSHILSEVEMTCRRVLILNRGRIVASDTTRNLVGLMKAHPRVRVQIRGPENQVAEALGSIEGVIRVTRQGEGDWMTFSCECEKDADPRLDLFRTVTEKRWDLRELTMEQHNLEDVFVEMTSDRHAL